MTMEAMEFAVWGWLFMGSLYYLLTIIALHQSGDLKAIFEEGGPGPLQVLIAYLIVWPLLVLNHLRSRN